MSDDIDTRPEWKIQADNDRLEMVKHLKGPLDQAYEDIGLDAQHLAREHKRLLRAKRVSWQKIKGALPQDLRLPPGYRVITPTERVEWFDPETGVNVVAEPGESIIEHVGPDNAIILKTADAIIKNRGWGGADKIEQTNQGTIIHVHTHVAKPLPLPSGFQQVGQEEEDSDGIV